MALKIQIRGNSCENGLNLNGTDGLGGNSMAENEHERADIRRSSRPNKGQISRLQIDPKLKSYN